MSFTLQIWIPPPLAHTHGNTHSVQQDSLGLQECVKSALTSFLTHTFCISLSQSRHSEGCDFFTRLDGE